MTGVSSDIGMISFWKSAKWPMVIRQDELQHMINTWEKERAKWPMVIRHECNV